MVTVYQASAGSGKTFTLAKEYIFLLFGAHASRAHRRILAVTFTKKATAEMKQRIVDELAKLSTGNDSKYAPDLCKQFSLSAGQLQQRAQTILTELLQDYSAFAVTTIDSFFQQIVRSFARELDLPGSYNVELDSNQILQRAVDDLFFQLPPDLNNELSEALLAIIEENMENDGNWDPKNKILTLSKELLKEVWQRNEAILSEVLESKERLTDFRKQMQQILTNYWEKYRQLTRQLMDELAHANVDITDFPNGKDVFSLFLKKNKEELREEIKAGKDYKRLRKLLDNPQDTLKNYRALIPVWERLSPIAQQMLNFIEGEPSRQILSAYESLRYLSYLTILQTLAERIAQANHELNRLPLAQTNALINSIVKDNDTPFIYDKVGTRISHYMIDEFQDTSAMQWDNFRPLLAETDSRNGKNLIVGDIKQSIYRWRNSDYTLMQKEVKKDFPSLEKQSLNDNWRSDEQVVSFNNFLFNTSSDPTTVTPFIPLPQVAQQHFAQKLKSLHVPVEGNQPADDISSVYLNARQTPQKTSEQGYVEVNFIKGVENKNERRQWALDKLPEICKDITNRGISPGKIAFLIRNNDEAVAIATTLIGAGFKVMSNEGLRLTSSPEVQLCICLLRLTLAPDDRLLRLNAQYYYSLLKNPQTDALQEALAQPFPVELEALLQPSSDTLYSQIEQFISTLGLNTDISAAVYLQCFKDAVFNYLQRYQSDLCSFLDWWDNSGCKTALTMSESDDAMKIDTIHKSKGLEYDVVIVPFCDWDVAEKKNNNREDSILWVKPQSEPYNRLPLLPLKFDSLLSHTCFADDWKNEMQKLYIDNLNLAYVAFTRAKRELYVFAPTSYVNSKNQLVVNSEGALIFEAMKNCSALTELLPDDDHSCPEEAEDNQIVNSKKKGKSPTEIKYYQYTQGEKTTTPKSQEKPATAKPQTPILPSTHSHLQVRLPSRDFFNPDRPDLSSTLNLGIVMHDILASVTTWDEMEKMLDEYAGKGTLTPDNLQIVRQELNRLRSLTADTDWFDPKWKILTEQSILLPKENMKRADRILINGKQAVVIDWKFGYQQPAEHRKQVKEYMSLLQQMGYEVQGFLCYVNRKEIISVEND